MVVGWLLLAVGLAAKVTAAYLLVVAFLAIFPRWDWKRWLLGASVLLPAIAWYVWADRLVVASGSRASVANRDLWVSAIGLEALASSKTWYETGRFLVLRSFTPVGLFGAACGLLLRRRDLSMKLWWTWAATATATMALLAAKLHHEYYWLCLAPVAAAGLGLAWARLDAWKPIAALTAAGGFAALALISSDSTWRTPDEWLGVAEAGRELAEATQPDDLIVAPEALRDHPTALHVENFAHEHGDLLRGREPSLARWRETPAPEAWKQDGNRRIVTRRSLGSNRFHLSIAK